MIDETLIKEKLQKGKEAKEKVTLHFSNLTAEQLNWRVSLESWSIAQCLEHLIISDSAYFPDLKKITEGNYKMTFWQKFNPLTRLFGKMFVSQLKEQVTKKMKAPKKLQPHTSKIDAEIVTDYHKNLDSFLKYISNCRSVDIDKIVISSPILPVFTYKLRDTFQFLLQHEHRHINQAIRVKSNENFPK